MECRSLEVAINEIHQGSPPTSTKPTSKEATYPVKVSSGKSAISVLNEMFAGDAFIHRSYDYYTEEVLVPGTKIKVTLFGGKLELESDTYTTPAIYTRKIYAKEAVSQLALKNLTTRDLTDLKPLPDCAISTLASTLDNPYRRTQEQMKRTKIGESEVEGNAISFVQRMFPPGRSRVVPIYTFFQEYTCLDRHAYHATSNGMDKGDDKTWLFGCLLTIGEREFRIEPMYRKQQTAKEQAAVMAMEALRDLAKRYQGKELTVQALEWSQVPITVHFP